MTASHCKETASDMRLVHTWFACNTHQYIKNIYSIKKRWEIVEKVHRIIIHTYTAQQTMHGQIKMRLVD